MFASSNLDDILLGVGPEDSGWSAHVFLVANTQLTVVIETPGKKYSFVIAIERGVTPTPNIDCSFGANLLDLARLEILRTRFKHAPNFPTFWVTPGPDFPVRRQSYAMV